jgi:bifunctional DNA-binding transcriptional regulator/antitoxin component of YhaV-PrlF toxin-antitoxin module
MHEIANIDKFGRILIPKKMRAVLRVCTDPARVFIEGGNHKLAIKPIHKKADDAVKKIAMMNLTMDGWELMEG